MPGFWRFRTAPRNPGRCEKQDSNLFYSVFSFSWRWQWLCTYFEVSNVSRLFHTSACGMYWIFPILISTSRAFGEMLEKIIDGSISAVQFWSLLCHTWEFPRVRSLCWAIRHCTEDQVPLKCAALDSLQRKKLCFHSCTVWDARNFNLCHWWKVFWTNLQYSIALKCFGRRVWWVEKTNV